jgi:hypothetical protein
MSDWSIINAPKATTVAISGLQAAIGAARPGEVITVTTAGAATHITLSSVVKGGYGVCVLLPLDQVVRLTMVASSNIHFFGGRWAADVVVGSIGPANIGINVDANSSKLSIHGGVFDSNAVGLAVYGEDVWINGCLFEAQRGDHIFASAVARLAVENSTMAAGAIGKSICYYTDGTNPVYGLNQATCTESGGTWEDATHSDNAQVQLQSTDVIYTGNTLSTFGAQGFVTFGNGNPNSSEIYRLLLANNTVSNAFSNGIYAEGYDQEVRDNTILSSPEADFEPQLTVVRVGSGNLLVGRNSAPVVNNPSGYDLTSASLNGQACVPPERPRIVLPSWKPTAPSPTPSPPGVPVYVFDGGIRPNTSPSVGQWRTIRRGSFTGTEGATWEYRWKRNGTAIGGATGQVYQIAAPDTTGDVISAEVRGTNAQGPGVWAEVGSVTVA